MNEKTERKKKVILILFIILIIVFLILIAVDGLKNDVGEKEMKWGISRMMNYEQLLEEYSSCWGIGKTTAMGDLENAGILDGNIVKYYQVLWVQLEKTATNEYGGYLQILCQVSEKEKIEKVQGVILGPTDENNLYFNGQIKVWQRETDTIEYVCHGEFGIITNDKPSRLQRVCIGKGEGKTISVYAGELSKPRYYCYIHQHVQLGAESGTDQTDGDTPRPAMFLHDTVYMESGEAVKTLAGGWEKVGVIEHKLASGQTLDESCADYTANCSSGEEGDEIYANEAAKDRIYLKTGNGTYAEYIKYYKPMICVQDRLYVRESGYASGSTASSLPEGWKKIGTIQKVIRRDEPMEEENFTGNDSASMCEGDAIYANEQKPDRIYLKFSDSEYILFVTCAE